MKLIAQTIPGLRELFNCNPVNNQGCSNPIPRDANATSFKNLTDFLSPLINIIFYIAVFIAFYFLIWGAFAYLMSQGKKENLALARARITYALVGLVVVFLAFFVATFASEIFPPTPGHGGLPF